MRILLIFALIFAWACDDNAIVQSPFTCSESVGCQDGFTCDPSQGICGPQAMTDAGPAPDQSVAPEDAAPMPDQMVMVPDATVDAQPPMDADGDGDGVPDDADNCPEVGARHICWALLCGTSLGTYFG